DQITNWIITAIGKNGVWAIFWGGIIEQIIIPIPSPLITMAGGFLLVAKEQPLPLALGEIFLKITLPYSVAAVLGLGIVYFIAYFGGKPLIEKFHRLIGFSWQDVKHLQKKFKGNWHDDLLIFVLRAIPVIPISIVSGVAGAVRMPIADFYIASALGVLIRSFILGFIGWQVGEAYESMAQGLDQVSDIFTILIAVIIFGFLVWGYKKRSKYLEEQKK
ncbi:MAG: VTT domain-containing protein, partial [Candidatus Shapirobacteria bacterium]|nr:VTT domain-containing protein [Candidatus Shapirobacteria bacterium]